MNKTNQFKVWLIFSMLISLIFAFYSQLPALTDFYTVNDDIYQSFGQNNKADFENTINLTKIIPFLIILIISVFTFLVGNNLRNSPRSGFISVFIMNYYLWQTNLLYGANLRAIGILAIIIFLYGFLNKNKFIQTIFISISLLLSIKYPTSGLIIGLSTGLYFLFNKKIKLKIRLISSIFFILSLLFILPFLIEYFSINQLYSLNEIKDMPEFGPQGRIQVFNLGLKESLTNPNMGLEINPALNILIIVFIILLITLRKKIIYNHKFNYILISVFILYITSFFLMMKLYWPGRYLYNSIPIIVVILTSINLDLFLKKIKNNKLQIIILIVILLLLSIHFKLTLKPYLIICENENLYNEINKLYGNNDIKIAIWPTTADCVYKYSYLNNKQILVMFEKTPVMRKNVYPYYKERTIDYFTSLYSNNITKINQFCDKYNITHFVIGKEDFNLNKKLIYFQPYHDFIKNITQNITNFYLKNPKEQKIVFMDKEYTIIEC